MNLAIDTGAFFFNKMLMLTPLITKKEIMNNDNLNWEPWPDKGCDTVSYRAIFNIKGNTHGDIYLIVNFIQPNDENAIIGSWSFAPYKLIDGEQKKSRGESHKKIKVLVQRKN
ncbi:hypothetical protein [Enterobacter ludwigii]|uniref:hypothetical protein n=1 Tax=Enterobacter ludwigii TaxID=299767 RepID=UPI0007ABC312|nr:hypothetical protein [Enterobacter ludwigii]